MESYLTDRAQFVEIRTAIGKENTTVRSALRNHTIVEYHKDPS